MDGLLYLMIDQKGKCMNELKVFENQEFSKVRTVIIEGEPWIVGKDVAVALGYANTRDALKSVLIARIEGSRKSLPPQERRT